MYKSCKEYFNCIVIRKLFKHKKRPDEHYFFLYSHSLITFMQKIDYQIFLYKINEIYLRLQNIR